MRYLSISSLDLLVVFSFSQHFFLFTIAKHKIRSLLFYYLLTRTKDDSLINGIFSFLMTWWMVCWSSLFRLFFVTNIIFLLYSDKCMFTSLDRGNIYLFKEWWRCTWYHCQYLLKKWWRYCEGIDYAWSFDCSISHVRYFANSPRNKVNIITSEGFARGYARECLFEDGTIL